MGSEQTATATPYPTKPSLTPGDHGRNHENTENGQGVCPKSQATLLAADQLRMRLEPISESKPGTLPGAAKMLWSTFTEHPVNFQPTYKFDAKNPGCYDMSAKKKVPAWPLRILWKQAEDVVCEDYRALFQCRSSQHRPVVGRFIVDVTADVEGLSGTSEGTVDFRT